MKKYNVNKEIEKYYKISMFINRYILILWSFLLSFLMVFVFNVKDNSVVAYANSDILMKTLDKKEVVVWKPTNIFNKQSKHIKAELLLTNSKYGKLSSKLWIWIFKDKYNIYYPMNITINNIKFRTLKTKEDIIKNYINILKATKEQNNKFIKPKLIVKTDKEIIKSYNLWCMENYLNNSIFCNINKNSLINDLITKNTFDISDKFYNKLFSKLSFSKQKKCDILTQIYNKKYNISRIKNVLEKNSCDLASFKKADEFIKEVSQNDQDLFKMWDILPKDYDVLMQKLTQQFYVIVTHDNVPDYMIYANIKLLKNMIANEQMDSTYAILATNVLNELTERKSFNKKNNKSDLIRAIKELKIWTDYQKWLNSYIKNKKLVSSNPNNNIPDFNIQQVVSEREKINNIFKDKYKDIFTITKKIKYNDKTKTANVEWFIQLVFNVGWNKKIIPVKVSFVIKNIIWTNFDIYNLKIFDPKILNYIKEDNISINPESLIDLKQILEDKLYAPLVNNDYWQYILSICDKFKKVDSSANCKDGKVLIYIHNANLSPSLIISFDLDKNLNLKNIEINSEEFKFRLNNLLKEEIDINLSNLMKKINDLNAKNWYSYKQIWLIQNVIESHIKEVVKENKFKLSWLTNEEIMNLNNKFKEFLWTNIKLVRKFKWYYKIFFNLKWITFWVLYDKSKNNIKWISIYITKNDKDFVFTNINITLASLDQEKLNSLKLETLYFLKNENKQKYNEYEEYITKNK